MSASPPFSSSLSSIPIPSFLHHFISSSSSRYSSIANFSFSELEAFVRSSSFLTHGRNFLALLGVFSLLSLSLFSSLSPSRISLRGLDPAGLEARCVGIKDSTLESTLSGRIQEKILEKNGKEDLNASSGNRVPEEERGIAKTKGESKTKSPEGELAGGESVGSEKDGSQASNFEKGDVELTPGEQGRSFAPSGEESEGGGDNAGQVAGLEGGQDRNPEGQDSGSEKAQNVGQDGTSQHERKEEGQGGTSQDADPGMGPHAGREGGQEISSKSGQEDAGSEETKFSALEEVVEGIVRDVGDRTLILATANDGYLDFLLNWFSFVRELGHASRVLIIAEDLNSFRDLVSLFPKQTVLIEMNEGEDGEVGGEMQAAESWRSKKYKKMVSRRPHYLQLLLNLGVAVLYSDIDMVWLRDPLPVLVGSRANASLPPFDISVMDDAYKYDGTPLNELNEAIQKAMKDGQVKSKKKTNKGRREMKIKTVKRLSGELGRVPPERDEGILGDPQMGPFPSLLNGSKFGRKFSTLCTCLIYVLPTEAGKSVIDAWMDKIDQKIKHLKEGEAVVNQPSFNEAANSLRTAAQKKGELFNFGVLPNQYFPSGSLFFNNKTWRAELLTGGVIPFVLHANWVQGHTDKVRQLMLHGLWRLPPATERMKKQFERMRVHLEDKGGNANAYHKAWNEGDVFQAESRAFLESIRGMKGGIEKLRFR